MKSIYKKVLSFILLSTLLVSCSPKEVAPENKEVKEFLSIFYTWNYDNRYTEYQKKSETISAEESQKAYYSSLEKFLTEDALKELAQARIPLKYDQQAHQNSVTSKVTDIEVSPYNDQSNVVTFTVKLELTQNGVKSIETKSGQISVQEDKEVVLIHNFTEQ